MGTEGRIRGSSGDTGHPLHSTHRPKRHLTTHALAVGSGASRCPCKFSQQTHGGGPWECKQGVARIRQCLSKSPLRIHSTPRNIGSSFSLWLVLALQDGAVSWPAALQSPTGDKASDVTQRARECYRALELSTQAAPEPQRRMHRLCHSGLFAGARNLARMTMKMPKRTKHHLTNCPTILPPRATKRSSKEFPAFSPARRGLECSAVRCLSARRPSSRHR